MRRRSRRYWPVQDGEAVSARSTDALVVACCWAVADGPICGWAQSRDLACSPARDLSQALASAVQTPDALPQL